MWASCAAPFQRRSCWGCERLLAVPLVHLVHFALVHLVHLALVHLVLSCLVQLVATTLVHIVFSSLVHLLFSPLVQMTDSTQVLFAYSTLIPLIDSFLVQPCCRCANVLLFWQSHTGVFSLVCVCIWIHSLAPFGPFPHVPIGNIAFTQRHWFVCLFQDVLVPVQVAGDRGRPGAPW